MGVSQLGVSTAGKTLYVQKFTTVGPNTFTLPAGYGASNPLVCDVFLVGGGGGAGGTTYNTTSGNYCGAGGGGGGAVKYETISLTANATAWVGDGGLGGMGAFNSAKTGMSHSSHGGNGEASWFGTSNGPANMFINPTFASTTNNSAGANDIGIPIMYFWGLNPTSYSPPFGGGTAFKPVGYNNGSTNAFRVYSAYTYTFSAYLKYDTSGSPVVYVANREFDDSGTLITTGTNASATLNGSTSWVRIQKTFTPNASTKYVEMLFDWSNASGAGIIIANAQLEIAASASSYKDGYTAGYTTYGSPQGNVTFSTSDNVVVANGGGGGAGDDIGYMIGTTQMSKKGFPGATSGGGSTIVTGTYLKGGAGGGAGGNASFSLPTTSSTSNTPSTVDVLTGGYVDFGHGTAGLNYASSTNTYYTDPIPGIGINGYGRGGKGFNSTGTFYSGAIPTIDKKSMSMNNTGHGGDAIYSNSGASANVPGRNGGSGIIVVKYWA